tara:strand:+ start:185 stop:979 length:795 start_codon:yes stop_codon:yes gene_type:complete
MDVLILCAGYGTRLAPLTDRIPKPLVQVSDKLSIEHQLEAISSLDPQNVWVNAHHLADKVRAFVDECELINDCFIEEEILGTGGPLKRALDEKNCDDLLVINGDVFHDLDLDSFIEASRQSGKEFSLLMMDNKLVNSVGIRNNEIISIKGVYGEENEVDSLKTFTGISWYSKNALKKLKAEHFSIVKFWKDEYLLENYPFAQEQKATWIDIGTPQGLWDASQARWIELGGNASYNWIQLETKSPAPKDEGPGLYGRDFQWKIEA